MKHHASIRLFAALFAACLAMSLGACRKSNGHGHASHHHEPPHGGTVIEFGDEEAFFEFVHDAGAGRLQCYVLAPHMDGFIRLAATSFELTATVDGRAEVLVFKAVANAATGETVGDTAQFEAQADWLKTAKRFDAVLKDVSIRGRNHQAVPFRFPEGNYPRKAGN
jgi:hypothetical protein